MHYTLCLVRKNLLLCTRVHCLTVPAGCITESARARIGHNDLQPLAAQASHVSALTHVCLHIHQTCQCLTSTETNARKYIETHKSQERAGVEQHMVCSRAGGSHTSLGAMLGSCTSTNHLPCLQVQSPHIIMHLLHFLLALLPGCVPTKHKQD